MPELERCVSALIADPLPITPMVSPSVRIEGDHPDDVAHATEACKSGSIDEAVTNLGMGADISIPMSGDLSLGVTVRPMGLETNDSSHHQTQWVNRNQFSPLSSLGNEMGFCCGKRDNFTKVSIDNGEKWRNPHAKLVSSSYLDGFELLHGGSEPFLL